METKELASLYRWSFGMMVVVAIAGLSFLAGIAWSTKAYAENKKTPKAPRTIYPEKTKLDFDGAQIEGELRNPGDFYFQHKPEEKMDSLVKRRKNFHREMLRDVVFSK